MASGSGPYTTQAEAGLSADIFDNYKVTLGQEITWKDLSLQKKSCQQPELKISYFHIHNVLNAPLW